MRDVATKPTKLEQTNEIPTIQFLTKFVVFFNCIHTKNNHGSAETQTIGFNSDSVTTRQSQNCYDSDWSKYESDKKNTRPKLSSFLPLKLAKNTRINS